MRILHLAQFHKPVIGGEERHVISLSEGQAARGDAVAVAALAHPRRDAHLVENGVEIRSLGGTMQRIPALYSEPERRFAPPFADPELTYGIARLIDSFKPDIVHAHNWLMHSHLPLVGRGGARFVVTLHDYGLVCARKTMMLEGAVCAGPSPRRCVPCASQHYGRLSGPVVYMANRLSSGSIARKADRIIAVSDAVVRHCRLDATTTPYTIIPTFIADDLGKLGAAPGEVAALPSEPFLLYVGDLNVNKGVTVLLSAYAKLRDMPPLVMIGRRCADMPRDLPAGVTVHESWPHAAVMHAWSRCLYGIAPSVWPEACGTIVMEANAVGRTMIVSAIGGLKDLVVDEVTGLTVEPNDPAALAKAMWRLTNDAALRDRMERDARIHADRFSARSVIPRIGAVYAEALQATAPEQRKARSA